VYLSVTGISEPSDTIPLNPANDAGIQLADVQSDEFGVLRRAHSAASTLLGAERIWQVFFHNNDAAIYAVCVAVCVLAEAACGGKSGPSPRLLLAFRRGTAAFSSTINAFVIR
jgi:hypothetical protein